MRFKGLKEISMFHKLLKAADSDKKNKVYAKSDIGFLVDDKYPQPGTHEFIKKLIVLKVLVEDVTKEWRGKHIQTYTINKKILLEVVWGMEEYKMLEDFFDEEHIIRIKSRV